ncbi:AVAST type 5 anti-phage protein Avs5 [Achromobacter mucicolens]|uniref:AVAST type 5 anti-phage protein Avs5 n=1 Tax=Achromobacter mucicolens TaxID=1389922 RepID=UPI003B9C8D74
MEQLHFTDPSAAGKLQALYRASRLIPFLGSGFTKDAAAKKGRVPDAASLVKLITDAAAARSGLSPSDSAEIAAIRQLKNAFSLLRRPEHFTPKQASTLLENVFYKVKIADHGKQRFLRLDWPHIFTFNVDDGIENSVHGYKVLAPNKDVSREYIASNPCLFKIHGDIEEYSKYEDYNLIFTWRDYAHSIDSNQAMLGYLAEEARNSAFLFIGCSLDAEIDLLNLTSKISFAKSIFLKKGRASIGESLTLEDYGIEQVIYFDKYEEISNWIADTLGAIRRENPQRDLVFNDAIFSKEEAIKIIANGGPLSTLDGSTRTVRTSNTFPRRTDLHAAVNVLRTYDVLLLTGRRFSGKTMFLYQLMEDMKEYGTSFYASADAYTPLVLRSLEQREQHLFVFDSNFLDAPSLDIIIRAKVHATSKIVICSSLGDAESFRYQLERRSSRFQEIELMPRLDDQEALTLNTSLSQTGLPIYKERETLLTFAYRYYDEYRSTLPASTLFSKNFDHASFSVMFLMAALEKAQLNHIAVFNSAFNTKAFLAQNDRIFECIEESSGEEVLVCNSSSWLITELGKFIQKDSNAISITADIAIRLYMAGFTAAAGSLIRFDKLNELGNGANVSKFIRGVYSKISDAYNKDSHYWLQRAKSELIGGSTLAEIEDGMSCARKVRADTKGRSPATYYSATLVLAQLFARAFKIDPSNQNLMGFVEHTIDSVRNYQNNKRHIDKLRTDRPNDFWFTLRALEGSTDVSLLPRKDDVRELLSFFLG